MKHFWLIRHAQTESSAASDIERQLSPAGIQEGALMADYLRSAAQHPEHAARWLVSSSATRAQQTSRFVAEGFEVAEQHSVIDDSLYLADPETLLSVLRETPESMGCVALVAHNPGLTWLVNALSGPEQQIDALPPFGCALFRSDAASWADLHPTARVLLVTPKQVKG